MNDGLTTLKFSINDWQHLYSLQQAVDREQRASGKHLSINGTIRNSAVLDQQDTEIKIDFYQTDALPDYPESANGDLILGQLLRHPDALSTSLAVADNVFEELRKNLMEYADIDGIHIVVTLGLSLADDWPVGQTADIVQLDYAMRGDA